MEAMMTDDDPLLTVDEVAARLRVHPETVRRLLRSGELRGSQPISRRAGWRIRRSDLERLLREQRRP
jgi:excisionase family DNA binding protein